MNDNIFWSIIDPTIAMKSLRSKTSKIKRALSVLSVQERTEFYNIYNTLFVSSYTPGIVSILSIIEYGLGGDDSFSDFRHWLIFLGSRQYKMILSDPDSIATHGFSSLQNISEYMEEYSYILSDVIEKLDDDDIYTYPDMAQNYDWLDSLETSLRDKDYIQQHFPKLYNIYFVEHPRKRVTRSEIDPNNILPDWLVGHLDP